MKPENSFALVAVLGPIKQPLVYSVASDLRDRVVKGSRVLVPLKQRIVTGVVLDVFAEHALTEVKAIIELVDERPLIDGDLLKLANWVARYYLASLGDVLIAMLPPNSRRRSNKLVVLKRDGGSNPHDSDSILEALQRAKGKLALRTLKAKFTGQPIDQMLARLAARGLIEISDQLAKRRTRRRASEAMSAPGRTAPGMALGAEQNSALNAIIGRIENRGFEAFLLHGVTGGGKTEVYLRAIERARDLGRRSLIIAPEISLTPQLLDRLHGRFPGRVGVLHSALTPAERWLQWQRVASGESDVVVGARSAVFAPVANLGLIVVDEEHDPSYKQEDGVRYNGRDVAVVRAKLLGCPVVLGSATPALESYENCRQGRYRLLEIRERVAGRPLPTITAVDLRQQHQLSSSSAKKNSADADGKRGERPLISGPLAEALQANFAAGGQTLIFLNRRGFANFLQCAVCGYVWHCPNCSVSLTVHLQQKRLSCHHCDYRRPVSDICPECGRAALGNIGSGTERIEQSLRQLLPRARVARMDRDTTRGRGSHEQIIRRWEKGEIDILVGTQMITKGHDVFGVTVVGALLADLSLNLPDFRAAERTFQLLTQVAGRAGRGDNPGRMIVQTYAPDHYAIEHLVARDYRGFFAAESEFRSALGYPPFSRLVNLRIDGPKRADVESTAKYVANELRKMQRPSAASAEQVQVLGPAPAPIEKLRTRYRWQILLRSKQSAPLLRCARHAREIALPTRTVRLHIDVDPGSML
jgi:primosomal protein N' (replication factor Y)